MNSIIHSKRINKALAEKLLSINIKSEEDLAKKTSVDVFLMLEKKHKNISLYTLTILEKIIKELKKKK